MSTAGGSADGPRTAPGLGRSLPPVYAAAALRLAFPLIVLPVMAARLGGEEFGRLSLMLVWAGLLSTLVEGGFLAAATRLAVLADGAARWTLAQQVFSARCALSAAAALLAVGVALWLQPAAAPAEGLASAALLAALACALGWPATWYLQASQQLHRWALVELAVYGLWLLLALLWAHSVFSYLLLNLLAAAMLALGGWLWLRRDLAPQRGLWSRPALQPGLRLGWTMMPVSLAGAAYSMALPAVASSQMSRSELGLYYLADRIVRSVLAAADPVFQLVYPRIVARWAQGARAAWRYAGRWAVLGTLAGALLWLCGSLALPALAPLLARGAASADMARLPEVMIVLGALLPLLLGWKFLGYCMLGSGRHDGAYRLCVVVGGAFGVLAAWQGASQGAVTLAWVALAVEIVVIGTAVAGMLLWREAPRTV